MKLSLLKTPTVRSFVRLSVCL